MKNLLLKCVFLIIKEPSFTASSCFDRTTRGLTCPWRRHQCRVNFAQGGLEEASLDVSVRGSPARSVLGGSWSTRSSRRERAGRLGNGQRRSLGSCVRCRNEEGNKVMPNYIALNGAVLNVHHSLIGAQWARGQWAQDSAAEPFCCLHQRMRARQSFLPLILPKQRDNQH
ncbi:hypothetical protein CEXT_451801 [Caerostris extrusa]|uniref:Uncharacterized protein n=1 Tax=Caerostris extrusa TaxID=172846 RepID=A0AAV4P8T4_CAEEX|nr:hypothetical protein CEXT_451801 [Caerostris extrusa]